MSEKVFNRFGARVAIIASVVIAASICCFVFNNVWIAVIMLSVAGFCNSLLYPIQLVCLNRLIPSGQRATLISVNSMFFSIAMIIIFHVTGFLADRFGLGNVLMGLGILLLVFILVKGSSLLRTASA